MVHLAYSFVTLTIVAFTGISPVTPLKLALIVESGNRLSGNFESIFSASLEEEPGIDWTNHSGTFNITTYREYEQFVLETTQECPFSVVVAVIPCQVNLRLYEYMRDSCGTSLLFTVFDSVCQRPPSDIGLGIVHLPSAQNVVPVFADFGIELGDRWRQVVVLYDTPIGVEHFSQFTSILKTISNENEVEEYKIVGELATTRSLSDKNLQILQGHKADCRKCLFLVIGSRLLVEKVILASKKLSLMNMSNKWVFIFTEPSPIGHLSEQVQDIISESDSLLVQSVRDQGCIEMQVPCLVKLLADLLQKSFHATLTSSTLSPQSSRRQVKHRVLSECKLYLSLQNQVESMCGNCDHYKVESLLKHRTNDVVDRTSGAIQVHPKDIQFKITQQHDGEWSIFKGLLIKKDQDSETNLKNRPLNIGIVEQPPLIRIYKNGIHGNSSQEIVGTNYEMVLVLAAKLNFTPNFVVDYSSNLGYVQSDGTWTGMLRKIVDKHVDIGANGFWATQERLKVVDFTFPFNLKEISMLVKKTDEDHQYLFLAPFTAPAWLSIMATVLLMGPFLWLVHRSSKYYEYYGLSDGKGLFKLGNCIWYCFGAIVQQGGDYLPLAISGRILITFWWLFVIVTVTTYSGNLVALLTFPKIFNPINDLNDLISFKNTLKYGATRTSGIEELVKDSADARMQMLADNLVFYEENLNDAENLFDKVKKMKLVFLGEETELRYLISEDYKRYNNCQLMIAQESIIQKSVSFVIGKDKPTPFKNKLDFEIGRMAKSGLITLWNKKYQVKGNDCLNPLVVRAGDVRKIELTQMIDCFFVLALGVIVALISLAVELMKPGRDREPEDKGRKFGFPKLARMVLHKVAYVYGKVKNGQLYENWSQGKATVPVESKLPAINQTRPIYHNYFTYNGRAGQSDWNAHLQRATQRPFYLQRKGIPSGPSWNGLANLERHTNLQRYGTPNWNTAGRF